MHRLTVPLTLAALCAFGPTPAWPAPPQEHFGMCDASAAVAVGTDLFVVANDEDNVLRLYASGKPGAAVASKDIGGLLDLAEEGEADIEGAARLEGADTVYWITSHGRNKNGKPRPNRLRLVALDIRATGGTLTVERVGTPVKSLLDDLRADDQYKKFDLGKAVAPEAEGGTNIEGLASWRGDQLLIGFRNPIPDKKALLAPLINPAEVVQGKRARFGAPIRLDLDGRGVRSIEYVPREGAYLMVAGPFDDKGSFSLYRWCGDPRHAPERIEEVDLAPLHPEALFALPDSREILLLSDDGDEPVEGKSCKDLKDHPELQKFRSLRISLPAPQ
jgi:hypothetical protein